MEMDMWVQKLTTSAAVLAAFSFASMALVPAAAAQSADMSPVLLIETGASDNPEYRRMTFVKYLRGSSVSVAYKAYNRSEFSQVTDTTPPELAAECAAGRASSMSDLRAYERKEAAAKRSGKAPEPAVFCIKNVRGWESGNKKKYLDPIFNGMPHAKGVY